MSKKAVRNYLTHEYSEAFRRRDRMAADDQRQDAEIQQATMNTLRGVWRILTGVDDLREVSIREGGR